MNSAVPMTVDEVGGAEDRKCLKRADRRDQARGNRRGDQRARAEAGDGDPGDQPALVGEPFHQRCDRHDVAKPEADAADARRTSHRATTAVRR